MSDLEYCIENFHKPRMTRLAEFLLNESEFPYEFFEPETFGTYMVQIKISDDLIISVNYFPIEISNDTPYLFLQLHCLLGDCKDSPSPALLQALSDANNATELSAFHVDAGQLYLKSVLTEDPERELDISKFSFMLRIFYNNLLAHRDSLLGLL